MQDVEPRNPTIEALSRALNQCQDINADLLAALEALTQGYEYLAGTPPTQHKLWDNAFAAVAKAKGIKE